MTDPPTVLRSSGAIPHAAPNRPQRPTSMPSPPNTGAHRSWGAMRWFEISPGFACNCRCSGCFSCSAEASSQMDWPEVQRWLRWGRAKGAQHLWLSGGEPTLRRDFFKTLRLAKHLGYQRIKVQTNGMLFSYEGFAEKAVAAGMNEVNLLLKSLDPKVHDALNRTPGSHRLLQEGLARLNHLPAATRPRLEGDILMTSRNCQEMPELVRWYSEHGLVHFNVWLFSLVDQGSRDLRRLVPRMADCRDALMAAHDVALAHGSTFCSLNTPHCAVPPAYWSMQFDAAGMELAVVNPGGHVFMLETSSIEQGSFVAACDRCAVRDYCHGMRSDYLEVHGDDELQPVSAEDAAGFDPRGSVLDLP